MREHLKRENKMVINFVNYVDQNCPFCTRKLSTTSAYSNHIKMCHSNPESEWYQNHKKVCPKCGKNFVGDRTYCSRSCANGHIVTEEHKEKTRTTLFKTLQIKGVRGKPIKDATFKERVLKEERFCNACGKEISWKNKYPYCNICRGKYISYSEEAKKKQSEKMKGKPRWHIHRNQSSYAELFFEKVLNNNSISFQREVSVKKDDNVHCYFLDFLIKKNDKLIDLEIDGSQHNLSERKESDMVRDDFLKNKNYIVYRIQWNNINSENGKKLIKEKIDTFLSFYKSI